MSHLTALFTNSPFAVFLAVLCGVLIGQVEYRGFALGSSGTLFAGLILGFLGFRVEHAYFSLSLALFIAAVGLLAARDINGAVTTHGFKFFVLGIVMTATGAAITALLVFLLRGRIDLWLLRASFMGALTSSPGLAAVLEVAPGRAHGSLSAGYAITYLLGTVSIILFEELVPIVSRLDMARERQRYHEALGRGAHSVAPKDGSVPFSLAGFALAIVLGAIVDLGHIPLGPLGTMTLSLSGGTLVAALVIGYFGHVGPVETRMSRTVLIQIREVALGIFLAVVGIEASATFVSTITSGGAILILSSVVISGSAMLTGYFLATTV